MPVTPIAAVDDYTFRYPEAEEPALRRISFSVRRGEFLTLCGPSGCGKTTLLRQFKPSMAPHGRRSGSILFDGLRTMNVAKILWGSLLSALLAILIDRLLTLVEKRGAKAE